MSGISADSRDIDENYLFIAVKGHSSDGHAFIKQAVTSGAKIVVGQESEAGLDLGGATYIKVDDSRKALSEIASSWFGNPAKALKMIGVTGTDGKTTTSNLIYWILKSAGKKVGLVSTVNAIIGNKTYDTGFHVTNPDPIPLNDFLAKMVKAGCEYAVVEVTSHGLDQDRVYGIDFAVSVLTNLTHEHIDYHKTFKNYAVAKAKLLNSSHLVIINSQSKNDIEKFVNKDVEQKYFAENTLPENVLTSAKSRFKEDYNILNSSAAFLVAKECGVSADSVAKAIENFPGVEGRMQEIKNDRNLRIIADFAHTPNALRSVLTSLSNQKTKGTNLIAVFGCAGERDVQKRQMMAEISAKIADISVFTAEDPRSEDVENILSEMLKGSAKVKNAHVKVIPERGQAVFDAINKIAREGDVVVICGKGHEQSMNYKGVEYPWSDKEAVLMALKGKIKTIDHGSKKNKKIAVFGLGIEGRDLVKYLRGHKLNPTLLEENEEFEADKDLKGLTIIKGNKVSKKIGTFDLVYRSPGVYRYRKDILDAEKKGTKISSGINLFFEKCPCKVIGVTGTKGKGTTSTLIYEILKGAGKDVYLAGNIGKPYLELLPRLKKDSIVVLELSSFQLIDIEKSPNIAVVLNITSDHLNWHENIKEYVDAKRNIVRKQTANDYAVINSDYKTPKSFTRDAVGKVVYFSRKNKVNGAYIDSDDRIVLSLANTIIGDTKNLLLMGKHNWENVAAATAASFLAGASAISIKKTVFGFKGLEHRLELVKSVSGVTFYNDSFSTNPEPTIAAVRSFTKPITLILGGYDKGLDYMEMANEIVSSNRVGNIILIGDTANKIKLALAEVHYRGKIHDMGKPGMEKIVKKSYEVTPKEGVVILSPASASFDMFENYKQRGKLFKEEVEKLDDQKN